jgi:hypothetical protein
MNKGTDMMTHTQMADRIIELADRLGYGVDVKFLPTAKPIKIKPNRGRAVSFSTFQDALAYVENAERALKAF